MLPPLDLSTLNVETPAGATLSTTLAPAYAAANCIDDNLATLCASAEGVNQYVSVQVAAGTQVDYVAVLLFDRHEPRTGRQRH